MIKLLPFLLLFSLANAQHFAYLMPDQNSLFSHTLESIISRSHRNILIITPDFNHLSLKRALLDGIKRGSTFTLIVQNLKGYPLELAQYENVDIRRLDGRQLQGSVILIDGQFACTVSSSIDTKSFSEYSSLIECSDEEAVISSMHSALQPLIKRSKPYLK